MRLARHRMLQTKTTQPLPKYLHITFLSPSLPTYGACKGPNTSFLDTWTLWAGMLLARTLNDTRSREPGHRKPAPTWENYDGFQEARNRLEQVGTWKIDDLSLLSLEGSHVPTFWILPQCSQGLLQAFRLTACSGIPKRAASLTGPHQLNTL